ncbi:hypothetical protein Golob_022027 [Gossypium lobatum]|uniref:YDG domain-containing protein n=1 Tax=Gossypium lobatum TaxID=34289 RepID=A0A7J8LFB5_9ROSI|nr:hypothetical protein [Gossypium lobatum]
MVSSRPEPVKEGPLSKSKQARHVVGKVVRHVKVHPRGICSSQQTAFTPEWYECRSAIKEALRCYRRLLSDKDYRESISKDHGMGLERGKPSGIGQHMRLAKLVRCLGKWVNTAKQIGCVAGIEVGDGFHWRGELCIVGLHSEFRKGIDCITSLNGSKIWATSIVDSGRYDSCTRKVSSDEFTYCGEGENPSFCGFKKLKDQKLVGGNLALMNNMIDRKPVRVIRRFDNIGNTNESGYKFVYEGLYQVNHCWKEIRMDSGKYVYKFNLVKLEDHLQYEPQWKPSHDVVATAHRLCKLVDDPITLLAYMKALAFDATQSGYVVV